MFDLKDICLAVPFQIRQLLRCVVAEVLATFLLIVLAASGTKYAQLIGGSARYGLAIIVVCVVTMRSNGAFQNPCMAVANWASGYEPSWQRTGILIIAEFFGGLLAAGLFQISSFETSWNSCPLNLPAEYIVTSMIASTIHVLVLLSVLNLNVSHGDPMYLYLLLPILLGLSGTLGHVFTVGCSAMNPAFSLALALSNWHWESHWIEWLGPFSGALIAAFLHRFVFQPRKTTPTTTL